jgi:hypothetical protein
MSTKQRVSHKTSRRGRRGDSNAKAVGKWASDAYSVGARALAGVNKLARLINIETKVFHKYSSFSITNSPTISCISLVPQGTDQGNRVGNSLKLQSFEMNYVLTLNTASTINAIVRIMIIRDLENAGSDPIGTDIFDLSTQAYISALNFYNKDRFTILYDKVSTLSLVNKELVFDSFRTSQSGHIKYHGSATSSASNAEGALYLVAQGNAVTNYPTIEGEETFTYTDD